MNEDNVYKLYLPLGLRIMLIVMLVFFVGISIVMLVFAYISKGELGLPAFFGILWIAIVAWSDVRFPGCQSQQGNQDIRPVRRLPRFDSKAQDAEYIYSLLRLLDE